MTSKVICGSGRKKRGNEADREEQAIRGGGVLTEFELIRQQNSSPARFCAVSSSDACVCVSMRVRGVGLRCLWWKVRGDWWFTEERWWVIHLRQPRQSPWQHEWPVICHPAQRPPLRSSEGMKHIHSLCFSSSSVFLHLTELWSCAQTRYACPPVCLLPCTSGHFAFPWCLSLSVPHFNHI